MIAQIPYELLLSLAYVSEISDPEVARVRFFESLTEIDPTYKFDYTPDIPQPQFSQEVVPIATLHSTFGYALMREIPLDEQLPDQHPKERSDSAIFRTAFRFLAVLLENRAQAKALEAEKTSLEGEVSCRNVQIREQEKRYRDIFENRHIVMLIIDPKTGRIVDANPAAVEFYGYPRDLLLAMQIAELNVQDAAQVAERLRYAKSRQIQYFSVQHRLADGSIRDVEVYTGPIVSEGVPLLFSIIHDITARLKAENELRRSIEEKDILLKELHHRVKNNLQIVSSMLSLQMSSSRRDDPETEFLKAQNRISTLSLIHEKLYQSEHFDRLDFGDYIESIVVMVVSAYSQEHREICYEVNIEPIKLDIDRIQPCGLIVNELVTNVIKHAFVDSPSGHLIVKARRIGEGQISLSVSDDGHSDRHNSAGIGLQLVDTLVKQLGGVIRSDTSAGGTLIEVVFPEA